jgi:hypothetical protein
LKFEVPLTATPAQQVQIKKKWPNGQFNLHAGCCTRLDGQQNPRKTYTALISDEYERILTYIDCQVNIFLQNPSFSIPEAVGGWSQQ